MRRVATFVAMLGAAAAMAPASRADYVVLKSGARLHITGYQQTGDRMQLTIAGGTVDVAASDVASIEPEEHFPPNPPPAPPSVAAEDANAPFGKLIHEAAAKHGVDENLLTDVIAAESNFNPKAVSRKRAQGLMQLMPVTAARYSVVNVFDPAQNIDAGTHYLKDLLAQYNGNLALALAAFNAGPDMVERYRGVPPFRETQTYVKKITTNLQKTKKNSKASTAKATAKIKVGATSIRAASPATAGPTASAAGASPSLK